MSEQTENLILEHLRAIRAGQDRLDLEIKEVKARLTSLESLVAGGRRDTVLQQEDIYRQQATIDRITERLTRMNAVRSCATPSSRHQRRSPR
jgi:hypothetical protein